MLKYMKNKKYSNKEKNEKSAVDYGTRKISHKSVIFFVIAITFLVLFIIYLFTDDNSVIKNKLDTNINPVQKLEVEQKWNSNPNLIDDRLSPTHPIAFFVSHSVEDYYVALTTMCLYNNGKYVTAYYLSETLDKYMEECIKEDAFVNKFIEDYEDNSSTDIANLITSDVKPDDIRNVYLAQYLIDDFSLESEVNTNLTAGSYSSTPFTLYFVKYDVSDEGISAKSNVFLMETNNVNKKIKSDIGINMIEEFFVKTGLTLD